MTELYNINWRKEIRQEFVQQLKDRKLFRGLRYFKIDKFNNTYASIRVCTTFDRTIEYLGTLVQENSKQLLINRLYFSTDDKDYYITYGLKNYHLHEDVHLLDIALTEEEAHNIAIAMQGKGCSFRIHQLDLKQPGYYGVHMSPKEFPKFCEAMFDLGKKEFTYMRGRDYWKVINNSGVKNVVKLE